MAIGVAASSKCFRFYKNGVLRSRHGCHYGELDHAIVIVGLEKGPYVYKSALYDLFGYLYECEYSPVDYCRDAYFESSSEDCYGATVFEGQSTPCCCRVSKDRYPDNDVWVVQNSWGVGWGDNGFIRFAKERGNGPLGMNKHMTWATVKGKRKN